MKRFFSVLLALLMLIAVPLGASAEIAIDTDELIMEFLESLLGSESHVAGTPSFIKTNNSTLTFYILSSGEANVSYSISLDADNTQGAKAEFYIEKNLWGIFWDRLDYKWTDTFTDRYHANSFTVNVAEEGLYRVVMTVDTGDDKYTSKAETEYKKDYVFGDVNNDSKLTAADARLVLRYSARLENSAVIAKKGDMNADGKVNAADARILLIRAASR